MLPNKAWTSVDHARRFVISTLAGIIFAGIIFAGIIFANVTPEVERTAHLVNGASDMGTWVSYRPQFGM